MRRNRWVKIPSSDVRQQLVCHRRILCCCPASCNSLLGFRLFSMPREVTHLQYVKALNSLGPLSADKRIFGNFNVRRLWLGLALGLLLLVAVCVDDCEAAKKKKAKKRTKPVDDAKSDDDDDADTEKSEGKKKAKADGKTDWKKMTKVAS